MHILYVILLLKMFQTSHATSGDQTIEKGSTSAPSATEPPSILPLTLIDLGGSCINPTKIEADWINKNEQVLGGGTKFSAEVDGDLKFMCANKPLTDSANTMPSNDQNCVYPMKFEKTDHLKCFHEPEPVISELKAVAGPISVITNVRCGQGGRGKMYRYVYKICMTENPTKMLFGFNLFKTDSVKYRYEFEVYRFCFDEQENAVVYTEHRIYSPNLLNEPALGEEQKRTFEIISGNYEAFGKNPDGSGRIFKWTTVPNETQINSDNVPSSKKQLTFSKNQKLVPPEDFAFALWKKPTYDHLNSKKMRSDRATLWNHINKIIRDDAIFNNREYYIKTQAFKMTIAQANLQETNTSEPHIWMKKVFYFPNLSKPSTSYKNKAIVVLMVTESNPQIDSEMKKRCVHNLCPDALKESYFYVGNFIYCCSMITNEALSEHGVNIDEDLDINFLTNVNRGTKREREDDVEDTTFL